MKGYLKVLEARSTGGFRVLQGLKSKVKEVRSQGKDYLKILEGGDQRWSLSSWTGAIEGGRS